MRLAKGRLALIATLAGAALAIVNTPAPALAQSTAMTVTIPFDFHVGDKTLPSGNYIVNRSGEAIQISDSKGHSAFVLSTAVANPAAKQDSQLIFNRYGDDSYLSEVRWFGYTAARSMVKSTNEVELAKAFTGKNVLSAGLTK